MSVLRRTGFAGTWYPGKASVRKSTEWFSDVEVSGLERVKGVIVPHAGWTYSGRIAAESFAHMQGMDVERVIVMGPCHRYYTRDCMLTQATQLETPGGVLDVDMEAQKDLNETGLYSSCRMADEENEHSLEIELPFIHQLFGTKAKIVMIMVGNVSEKRKVEYAKSLVPYMKDPKTVFVISSDFCHWGPNFDFQYYDKSKGAIWQSIEALDKEGVQFIESQDANGFAAYMDRTETTICGHNCIEIYLRALKESGLKTETSLLRYGQSNQVTDMYDTSVSYCAIRTTLV
ncbi:hypothetical protein JH06_2478 [Blastocystis sp. subtype 4]|uniref:hypothetical protein n=1 Tax=Blastocystis sp. subtype 4 TaxID=944170 RepID=UPI000711FDCB|nr:hypothetical protein JH06_2478 [Blastocystis sp. subtype 4]KNB43727.1 hypothetical protein JH06_2478 [Blastocystis sp. subtype 4]|eukprot:XP_014527170.1 hypothetical protein JH06_2478 [Blastocystis sp. subtype 4]